METMLIKFTPDVLVVFKTVPAFPAAATAAKLDPGASINGVHFDGTTDITIPMGVGDVVGPAIATPNEVALFNGATGKLLKGGGLLGTAAFYPANEFASSSSLPVNVKSYGATGNGSTDDHAAIATAVAALTSFSSLYFPPGKYRTTGQWTLDGIHNVKIFGDAAEIHNDSGAAGGNTFVVNSTCQRIEFHDLSFTGTSTVRGSGIHIRLYSDYSGIYECEFSGCSDFGVHIGRSDAWQLAAEVINCVFTNTRGDGVHIGGAVLCIVEGCVFYGTGDDAIGVVADNPTYQPNRIIINANDIYEAGMLGTSGCGIRVAESTDVTVTNNRIYKAQYEAIRIARYLSTTKFSARILIANNAMIYSNQLPGSIASIVVEHCNECTITGNTIDGPINGGGIGYLDCERLVISNNAIKTCPTRGIGTDSGSVPNCRATVQSLSFVNNIIDDIGSGGVAKEALYIAAPVGSTIANVMISGNVALNCPGPSYIFTNNIVTAAKIVNNTSMEGLTIVNGGSGILPTMANNN